MTATTTTAPGRWGVQHTRYTWPQCRFCGRAGEADHPDCRPATCPACGSRQCNSRSDCHVCLVGILPNWWGSHRECGYACCENPAVAKAPRIGAVCVDHLSRPTRQWAGKKITLADDIARRVAERDGAVPSAYMSVRFVWVLEATA